MTDADNICKVYKTIPDPIKLFLCYSREDEILKKRLEQHLEPMKREGLIIVWCDRNIPAGKDFLQEIKLHLDTSDILLAHYLRGSCVHMTVGVLLYPLLRHYRQAEHKEKHEHRL